MLAALTIRNFVLIEDASLQFEPGLSVLTGETGAGKTLLTKALGLLVGERAEDGLVGRAADEALVQAIFEVEPESLKGVTPETAELVSLEAGEMIVTRRLSRQGRNKCFINDTAVTLATLAEVVGSLLSFAGQHEYRRLLDPAYQLAVLDEWAGAQAMDLATRTAEAVIEARETDKRLLQAQESRAARLREIDYLNFQTNELAQAGLSVDEEQELLVEQRRLARAGEILRSAGVAADLLSSGEDQPDAASLVAQAASCLTGLAGVDESLDEAAAGLLDVQYQIAELSRELHGLLGRISVDPERLRVVEERLRQYTDISRKYGGNTRAALAYLEECSAQLAGLKQVEDDLLHLEESREGRIAEAMKLGAELTALRREAAPRLEEIAALQLADVGMTDARFGVRFVDRPGWEGMRESGSESIEFMLAANGGPPRGLAKTASGGELSRILLALKCALAGAGGNETLVLDEVDAGIGGRTATAVGRKIRELARNSQVIVVTHLAQVAAMAQAHYVVEKETGETASTRLYPVEGEARVDELCRMLGGSPGDAQAMALARQLRDTAAEGLID